MKVVTTTLCYPTPNHPDQGVFVQRRARALAAIENVDLRVVAPQLWCPLLRRYQPIADQSNPLPARYPKMVSAPVASWVTDGVAFAAALERSVRASSSNGSNKIDLIDAHFVYPDGVGAWLASRRLGIPVVVTVRGKIVSLSRRAVRRMQISTMLRHVDGLIAVSQSLADWVHRIAGSDVRVDVIPNGVDVATYHMVDRQQARAELGWKQEAQYLLAVGHLQRLKGFDRIVAILPAIRARLGDVRLVLAGSCRGERLFRYKLSRLMASCGGSPAVTFVGPCQSSTLNRMYNAADLVINASRSEGWNNAITESLAAGTAVIATDVGGNAEQIYSPELGTVVPSGHGRALTDAIIAGLSNEWNRPLIAAHASARTWAHVATEVHAVFRRVLAERKTAKSRAECVSQHNPLCPEPIAPNVEVPR